jgi:hypothetical protein
LFTSPVSGTDICWFNFDLPQFQTISFVFNYLTYLADHDVTLGVEFGIKTFVLEDGGLFTSIFIIIAILFIMLILSLF